MPVALPYNTKTAYSGRRVISHSKAELQILITSSNFLCIPLLHNQRLSSKKGIFKFIKRPSYKLQASSRRQLLHLFLLRFFRPLASFKVLLALEDLPYEQPVARLHSLRRTDSCTSKHTTRPAENKVLSGTPIFHVYELFTAGPRL